MSEREDDFRTLSYCVSLGSEAEAALARIQARVEALEGALREADEALSGMWSYNETSRTNMAHTHFVKASTTIRAALAGEPDNREQWKDALGFDPWTKPGESEPPTTCPTCRSSVRSTSDRNCRDPWHTVPTGTTPKDGSWGSSNQTLAPPLTKPGVPTGTDT